MSDTFHVYGCAEWGAAPPDHQFDETDPDATVIHHMDWPNRPLISDPEQALQHAFQAARNCQRDHMQGNGWSDTGQNFTVTREGIVLEGRHGSLAAARRGKSVQAAHAPGGNYNPGIEVEGTYTSELPPAPQWTALVDLCAHLAFWAERDSTAIKGHRDYIATQCPGDAFYAKLPQLRADVHQRKLQLINEAKEG